MPTAQRSSRSAHASTPVLHWLLALLAAAAAAAIGVVAQAPPAHAQTTPNDDLRSYVLFGFEEVSFKGGQLPGRGIIDGGNIGANGAGFIRGNDFRVNVCSNARMVMSDNTMVVGATMRLGDSSTPAQECDVYEAFYNTGAPNNETPRSGPAQPFTPPVIKASPPFPDFECDPTAAPVNINGVATLPPGTYNTVNFQNGSTVTLLPGTYVVCDWTTGQNVTVITPPAGGVVIQSESRFFTNDGTTFDGNDCATIPVVYARGDGLGANDNAVRFGQDSTIWGHFYTPNGRLNLGNQTDLHGTFWAKAIASDFNVNVEYCEPPHPTPEVGSVSLTKQLSGATEGAPAGATFGVTFNCTLPGPGLRDALDQTVSLEAGETLTFEGVQVGTSCTTVAETRTPAPLPGFIFDPPTVTPSSFTVDTDGQLIEILVDNPLREIFGTIQVLKTVSEDTEGVVPGSIFGFALDCDEDAFDTTFELGVGETFSSDPIHVGVPCTVRETDVPDPAPGFDYHPPVFDPSPTVTVTQENQVVTVGVDNPIGALVGRVRIHKVLSGAPSGYIQGSMFGFTLDCDGDAFDTTVDLGAGDTFTSDLMPVGTTCTVAETSVPAPAAGFAYRPAVLSPSTGTVTVAREDQVVTVTVTNRLTAPAVLPADDTRGPRVAPTLADTGGPSLALPLAGFGLLAAGTVALLRGRAHRQ